MAVIPSAISNNRLHCCLVGLILFILIFLSLPLLLIYLSNINYEIAHPIEQSSSLTTNTRFVRPSKGKLAQHTHNRNQSLHPNHPNNHSNPNSTSPPGTMITTTATTIMTTTTLVGGSALGKLTSTEALMPPPFAETINCTQYAIERRLSMADENGQCSVGTFECQTCRICVPQQNQCNGHDDCPDRSDESGCHDSNGVIFRVFKQIVNATMVSPSIEESYAKPVTCTLDEFQADDCPCVISDPKVVICDRANITSIPSSLRPSVYKIRMSENQIESLENVHWPAKLTSLVLLNNQISSLPEGAFESAPHLSKVYLSNNQIAHIHPEALRNLSLLEHLQIDSNRLRTFEMRWLAHSPKISKLYLSHNLIELPRDTKFSRFQEIIEIWLDHNNISKIRSHYFSHMASLKWLSLTHNRITHIEPNSFDWNYELEELNLSYNLIKQVHRTMFASQLNIQKLYLSGNPIRQLPVDAFSEISTVKSLNLTEIELEQIDQGTFSKLRSLEFIYFARFRYCHYASHVRICRPLTDGVSSVEELLAFPTLKYAVWIVATFCTLGNVFVLVWRSISTHEDQTLSLLVKNLSVADLMMGVYLCAIGYQDWLFRNKFGRHAIEWMSSWNCTAIGFLATMSSELSVFILTIITIERYRCITSTKAGKRGSERGRALLYVCLAWLLSFSIALYPLIEWLTRSATSVNQTTMYATNGLCLPLHIDNPFTPGWKFSALVYVGINFGAVIISIALYAHMYLMIMRLREKSRPKLLIETNKREDAILAMRFFFIVVTDCVCWIPIVVIKLIATLGNVGIPSTIYGWLVVFIIPINSALNPILYTLAAPTSFRDSVCKLFERLCLKLDHRRRSNQSTDHKNNNNNKQLNMDLNATKTSTMTSGHDYARPVASSWWFWGRRPSPSRRDSSMLVASSMLKRPPPSATPMQMHRKASYYYSEALNGGGHIDSSIQVMLDVNGDVELDPRLPDVPANPKLWPKKYSLGNIQYT